MPVQLLPASAQAFAPRSAPEIVLNSKVESWLTQTLKRINRVKRPLNSVPQHHRCLTETLGGTLAIWTLASLMLPKAPDADLRKDDNPLTEALFNHQLIHIEAYVVHVDMVSQHEVAFKLTTDTIELLIEYHKDIYSVDASASTWSWPEKESHVKKMQDEFVQAANKFVFRTHVRALEGLEEDGAGELLEGRSEDVKNAIMNITHPPDTIDGRSLVDTIAAAAVGARASCARRHMTCSTPIAYTTAPAQFYSSPQSIAPMPALIMPHQMPHHCGVDMVMGGYSDFGWSQSSWTPQYATTF
ncbi:unnamed protein product [Zymoseptoria tritici ST99CH_3D7]|uniref:Uncharacterized protein n=1 Tax=Zymoseptoria tritici (strain ST99CH_3D7) TaxID=1276538 RepID=A0A1X7RES2_ZYMT9|nr:unnamed protein product [Zymoseptoria tritici ST99CH_3D7]